MNEAAGAWLISDRLFEIAEQDPERELVFDPAYGRFTYGDIARQVERLAFGLREIGIGPGDIVVIQLPNWTPFIVFHLALTAVGAVTVNIPTVFRDHEVGGILRMTDARALVIPRVFRGHDFMAMAENLRHGCEALEHVFTVGGGPAGDGAGMIDYAEFIGRPWESAGYREALTALGPGVDDVTALGFTSGTTGGQKGAIHDSRILAEINTGLIRRYGLGEHDRIFGGSPFGHAVGFTHLMRMTLSIGAGMVLLEHWEPRQALELIHREGCTFLAGATPFLMDIVYHPELERFERLPSLRLFLCGGATIPEKLMLDAMEALPHTFVSPLWGMTECGGASTCPPDAPAEKLYHTDGKPCDSMEFKVVGPDGTPVPAGEKGELMVRGPMVARGYFRLPELTAEHFGADGFFRTGDEARMDGDGYIRITGRIKDLVIRGGVNISPAEIESVLFSHPKIVNAAIVGMPDPRLGERICVFVIFADGKTMDIDEICRWMAEAGVSKTKWPERLEALPAFPMTAAGKIQKFRLREIIAERLALE